MVTGPGITGWRSAEEVEDAGDTIAFTCGHKFGRSHYVSHIVPQLSKRLEELPVSQPVTFAACVEVALQESCSSACPPCCYNRLREGQLNAGGWKAAAWKA